MGPERVGGLRRPDEALRAHEPLREDPGTGEVSLRHGASVTAASHARPHARPDG
ncbi:hypothetical protein GCM10009591_20940 [Brachybacterium tyrofermentans]